MNETWQQILGRDDPVSGRVDQFQAATDEFHSFAGSAQAVASEFHKIQYGYDSDKFSGEAATAFRETLKEISGVVDDLPKVLRGIEGTFRNHATELELLRRAADEALARARTHWRDACSSRDGVDEARTRRSRLLRQLESLEAAGDGSPSAEHQIEVVRDQAEDATQDLRASEASLRSAEHALDSVAHEWKDLADAEDELDRHTRKRLEVQELWDLGDPSNLEKVAKALAEFASELWNLGVLGLLDVIPDDILWALHDALEVLSMALGIISLLALIPGLQGLAVFALAGLVVGALKLIVDGVLYLKGSVNPATGKSISGWGLLWDGVSLAVGGIAHGINHLKISDIEKASKIIHPIRQVFIVDKVIDAVHHVQTVVEVGGLVEGAVGQGPASGGIGSQAAQCDGSSWDASVSDGSARLVPVGAW